jgi:hypothetical protein
MPLSPYDTYEPPSATPTNKTCAFCGDAINVGDDYYDFYDKIVCEDCLSKYTDGFKHEAEATEPDYDF